MKLKDCSRSSCLEKRIIVSTMSGASFKLGAKKFEIDQSAMRIERCSRPPLYADFWMISMVVLHAKEPATGSLSLIVQNPSLKPRYQRLKLYGATSLHTPSRP